MNLDRRWSWTILALVALALTWPLAAMAETPANQTPAVQKDTHILHLEPSGTETGKVVPFTRTEPFPGFGENALAETCSGTVDCGAGTCSCSGSLECCVVGCTVTVIVGCGAN